MILFTIIFRLNTYPAPAIWDEGWTLSVAKNWVQDGFYGQYKGGEPQPPGLSASYTVVVPIAISFKLFGVGIWQERLPIALFGAASLFYLFMLGRKLGNARIGWGAVLVAIILTPHPLANPIQLSRYVMAEMPMLCFFSARISFVFTS